MGGYLLALDTVLFFVILKPFISTILNGFFSYYVNIVYMNMFMFYVLYLIIKVT